jgi:hypothetical protein
MRDPDERRRELADDIERKAAWSAALSQAADHNGQIDPETQQELASEFGEVPEPSLPLAPDPEPTPPGDGGAIEHGSPSPAGTALDAQIREAEQAGDWTRAIALKNQQLLEIHERMEGSR